MEKKKQWTYQSESLYLLWARLLAADVADVDVFGLAIPVGLRILLVGFKPVGFLSLLAIALILHQDNQNMTKISIHGQTNLRLNTTTGSSQLIHAIIHDSCWAGLLLTVVGLPVF